MKRQGNRDGSGSSQGTPSGRKMRILQSMMEN